MFKSLLKNTLRQARGLFLPSQAFAPTQVLEPVEKQAPSHLHTALEAAKEALGFDRAQGLFLAKHTFNFLGLKALKVPGVLTLLYRGLTQKSDSNPDGPPTGLDTAIVLGRQIYEARQAAGLEHGKTDTGYRNLGLSQFHEMVTSKDPLILARGFMLAAQVVGHADCPSALKDDMLIGAELALMRLHKADPHYTADFAADIIGKSSPAFAAGLLARASEAQNRFRFAGPKKDQMIDPRKHMLLHPKVMMAFCKALPPQTEQGRSALRLLSAVGHMMIKIDRPAARKMFTTQLGLCHPHSQAADVTRALLKMACPIPTQKRTLPTLNDAVKLK